jgi:CheY-like chemotaxis protein
MVRQATNERSLRILVAEPTATGQKLAQFRLSQAGHVVVTASDGAGALVKLGREKFDVGLLGIDLTSPDIWEVARSWRVQESIGNSKTPLFVLSSDPDGMPSAECAAAGLDGVLQAPPDPMELQTALSRAEAVPAFEPASLMTRVNGDRALLRRLHDVLKRSAATWIAELDLAIAAGDAAATHRVAHTAKGALGNFAAVPAAEAARSLDQAARSGDLSEAAELFARLRSELERLQAAVGSFVAE